MIALKLLFQSFAGVGSVLVCAGGGYYVMKEGNENIFYLVSSKTPIPSTLPTKDLWESKVGDTGTEKSDKQYKCLAINPNSEDTSCELYKITKTTGLNSIDLATLKVAKETPTKAMKADLATLKFFLLKTSSSFITKAHRNTQNNGPLTINLASNAVNPPETSTNYGVFTVHGIMKGEKLEGETNLAIAKVTTATTPVAQSVNTAEANSVFKCLVQGISEEKLCSISDLGAFDNKELNKIEFTGITTIPAQNTSTTALTTTNYYLISWDGTTKYPISSLNGKTVVLTETKTSVVKKTTILTIESGIFGIFSSTTQEAIIIK